MIFIEWDVNFYSGLPDVDQHHRKLITLANRLSEVPHGKTEILDQAFLELRDYISEHFSLEERLMQEAQIDAVHFKYHRGAHALFVAKVTQLWNSRNNDTDQDLKEMLKFLKSWILQHILQTDRKMAQEIHEKLGTDAPHNMFTHF